MSEITEFSEGSTVSEQPSGHLRWRIPKDMRYDPTRLQQLWYITTYRGAEVEQKEEWRDVPMVSE